MRALLAAAMLCLCAAAAHAESGIASVYGGRDGYCGKPRIIQTRASGLAAKVRSRASFDALPASAGPWITVTINDRGAYLRGRIIDLTPAAAPALGFSGLARVTVEPHRPVSPAPRRLRSFLIGAGQ